MQMARHPSLDLPGRGPPPGIQAVPPSRELRPKPKGRRKCEPCSPVTHYILWGKSTLTRAGSLPSFPQGILCPGSAYSKHRPNSPTHTLRSSTSRCLQIPAWVHK